MSTTVFFQPVMVLILWTLIIWGWLYATRIPAMQKAKISPQDAARPGAGDWREKIPASVHWKADNYNHLHEQPTIFYALMVVTAITGGADLVTFYLGWAYVVLRIVHSLIQATVNHVMTRFMVFALSSITLIILAVTEALRIFAESG